MDGVAGIIHVCILTIGAGAGASRLNCMVLQLLLLDKQAPVKLGGILHALCNFMLDNGNRRRRCRRCNPRSWNHHWRVLLLLLLPQPRFALSLLSMSLDPICADPLTSKHRRTDTDGISIVLESFVVPSPIVKEAANVVERRRSASRSDAMSNSWFSFIYQFIYFLKAQCKLQSRLVS